MKNKLILLFGFLATALILFKPPIDPDLGWHLRNGQVILAGWGLADFDTYTHTYPSYFFANFSWLSDVLLYTGYQTIGLTGLAIFFAILSTAAIFLSCAAVGNLESLPTDRVRRQIDKYGRVSDPTTFGLLNAGLAFFTAILLYSLLGVRAQSISFFLFSFLWWILRTNRQKPLVIFVLFSFWANLHPGFLLGLLLVWCWYGGKFLSKTYRRFFLNPESTAMNVEQTVNCHLPNSKLFGKLGFIIPDLRQQFVLPLTATFATFFTPYGLKLYMPTVSHLVYTEKQNQIAEWLSPDFHTVLGLLLFIYLLSLVIVIIRNKDTCRIHRFLLAGFIFLALFSIRYAQFLPIVGNILIVDSLSRFRRFSFLQYYRPLFVLFFPLFFLMGVLSFGKESFRVINSPEKLAEQAGYPFAAVKYLRTNLPAGEGFNPYAWGGYLIWELPQKKVFIDGRTNSWRKDGTVLLDEYGQVYGLRQNWEKIMEKYRISWALVEPDSPLAGGLRLHPEWRIVFEDKVSVIFEETNNFYFLTKAGPAVGR